MNARFAAVALSSCLSVLLVSQLFPLPSLTSLVEANKRSRTPLAKADASSAENAAKTAQAPQVIEAPQVVEAPQTIEARQAVEASQVIEPPQAIKAAQAIEPSPAIAQPKAMIVPDSVAAPEVADAAPSHGGAESEVSSRAAEVPQSADAQQPGIAAQVSQASQAPAAPLVAADEAAGGDHDTRTDVAGPAATVTTNKIAAVDQPRALDKTETKPVVASADPSETLPAAESSSQAAAASTPAAESNGPADHVSVSEANDECFVMDTCVDRYLWTLYQRAPKEDTIRVPEQRQVTIKRKRKWVTVTRTFFRSEDEDFAWKDRKAAEKAGLPMEDYVIGGMDREFKLKLFYTLHAAEAAGLSPGITSAFRDDYRQSIASGLKAASNRSYHGGSLRGGYGHGLAADIVSTSGATRAERWTATEALWKWVDAHGKDFGIGRPYLSYDPPHVGPTDGQEYISKRGGDAIRQALAAVKPRKRLVARHEGHAAKRAHHVASVQGGKTRSARNTHARAT